MRKVAHFLLVAQLVEQSPFKRRVAGSNPAKQISRWAGAPGAGFLFPTESNHSTHRDHL